MGNTNFKKAFDSAVPDMYMQGRLLANIKEKQHKRAFPLKPVLSGALALAVALGCFGAVRYQSSYIDRPFSVLLVDASEEVTVTEELDEKDVVIQGLQIGVSEHESCYTYEGGLLVESEDIDYVRYKSKTGSFSYNDWQKMFYDQERREYFTQVIPVADDEAQEMLAYIGSQLFNPEQAGLRHYAETHDLFEYFGTTDIDFKDYWVYFEKCADMIGYENEQGYAFFVIEYDKGISYSQNTLMARFENAETDLTVQNYELKESTLERLDNELKFVYYSPDAAIYALLDNPDMNKAELPDDEITIIAAFKDGKKAKKVISVTFNEDGYAQFAVK